MASSERPPAAWRGTWIPYAALLSYLGVVRLVVAREPELFRSAAQAAVFTWPLLGATAALGALGAWRARREGFPEMWDGRVPLRWRLGAPLAAGALLGGLAVGVDRATGWAALAAARLELTSVHIAAPASLLIYPGGAILVSVLYFLFVVPLLLWPLRGRGFPLVALAAAAIEPLTQDVRLPGGPGVAAAVFAQDYALNLAQVWLWRRAGFVPAVLLRVAFYAVWHVIWPLLAGNS